MDRLVEYLCLKLSRVNVMVCCAMLSVQSQMSTELFYELCYYSMYKFIKRGTLLLQAVFAKL